MKDRRKFRCDHCGEPYIPSRSDQKFCSDHCRYTFHNSQPDQIGPLDHLITSYQADYFALLKVYELTKEKPVQMELLEQAGFSFNFYGIVVKEKELNYFVLGDLAYSINKGKVLIRNLKQRDKIFMFKTFDIDISQVNFE